MVHVLDHILGLHNSAILCFRNAASTVSCPLRAWEGTWRKACFQWHIHYKKNAFALPGVLHAMALPCCIPPWVQGVAAKRGMTGADFFAQYPALHPFLLGQLRVRLFLAPCFFLKFA